LYPGTKSAQGEALEDLERIRDFPKSALTKENGLFNHLQSLGICISSIGYQPLRKQQAAIKSAIDLFLYGLMLSILATTAGLFLLVPLLIMVYVPGKTSSVVTTCLSVFVFANAMMSWSLFSHAIEVSEYSYFRVLRRLGLKLGSFEPKDIIGVTMAYAAVLVVFVGTSISTN
jgi:hypothetical protein